ncbi:RDD family protein [Clostridium paraputrificum]|uniref:RDD family protein n=1 Tax=Clostridium TaxID=1485 RepID=UPI003D34E698
MKKRLFASLLDEMFVFIASALGLLILELILRLFGFTMVTTEVFLLIIFFVANVLYYPIIEGSKYNTTFGKRIMKLDDMEDEVIDEEMVHVPEEAVDSIEEVSENEVEDVLEVETKEEA